MDDLGNRDGNKTLRSDGTVNFVVDDDTNRYTSIGGNTITHDNAGNLTTDKDGYQHEYDCENRIIRITDANDVEIATFDYDALNRRIRKVDSVASNATVYYYSDKWQVLQEYDSSDSLQKTFMYGNYIDEVLYMYNNSTSNSYFYVHNHLHSPVALLNGSGSVVERYEYDAYGKMTMLDPDFTAWSGTEAGNPYYFTGRRLDTLDSGKYEKMQYRFRGYTTYMARFYQTDPLGTKVDGYVDGMNLYLYITGNPNNGLDPYGMMGCPAGLPVGATRLIVHVAEGTAAAGVTITGGTITVVVVGTVATAVLIDEMISPDGDSLLDICWKFNNCLNDRNRMKKIEKCAEKRRHLQNLIDHTNSGWEEHPEYGTHLDAAMRQWITGVPEGADHLNEVLDFYQGMRRTLEEINNLNCMSYYVKNGGQYRRLMRAIREFERLRKILDILKDIPSPAIPIP